ncbi:hypothetical protein [Pandoraea sp. NPDC087047]|uniref:hypothetical protein n=1 Tax=Pandoraea sp. NPDC087047 TaxID=3364390 RepID=UPI00382D3AC4
MYFKCEIGAREGRDILVESRVLKRAAIDQLEQAIEIVRVVEEEAELRRAEQREATEVAEKAGYEAGEQRADRECAARLLEANQFMAQTVTRFESSFSQAVRLALTRIVDAVPDAEIVDGFVKAAYQDVTEESVVRVVVHPDHRDRIDELLQQLGNARAIPVVGDSAVAYRFCRIESPLGSVEMDADAAVAAMSACSTQALQAARVERGPAS